MEGRMDGTERLRPDVALDLDRDADVIMSRRDDNFLDPALDARLDLKQLLQLVAVLQILEQRHWPRLFPKPAVAKHSRHGCW